MRYEGEGEDLLDYDVACYTFYDRTHLRRNVTERGRIDEKEKKRGGISRRQFTRTRKDYQNYNRIPA